MRSRDVDRHSWHVSTFKPEAGFFAKRHAAQQALGVLQNICKLQSTFAFGGSPTPDGNQSRQSTVSVAIGRQQSHRRAVIRNNFCADQQLQARFLRCNMRSHNTRQRIAIRDGNRFQTKFGRSRCKLVSMRCPFKKRIIRATMELCVRK